MNVLLLAAALFAALAFVPTASADTCGSAPDAIEPVACLVAHAAYCVGAQTQRPNLAVFARCDVIIPG